MKINTCSLCHSPFDKSYAVFKNDTYKEIFACSRKCFIVFQTYMRAYEVEKQQNEKMEKRVRFSENVIVHN